MPNRKQINSIAGGRSKLIGDLLARLESQVKDSQRELLETVLTEFIDGMETDEAGNIKNTLANKRRFALFDKIFTRFAQSKGLETVQTVVEGVGKVMDFNKKYFSAFSKPAILAPIHENVKETVNTWLGIEKGKIKPNGYLDTLINDPTVKNSIRNIALKGVVSQAGYNETKANLKNHITGNQGQTGALERYYRNFTYDLYSVADRTNSKIYADKLKFNYAIYEGGLIETSRDFCEERNGKVFSREEISKFDPPTAKPPGYEPFTDLGGYGCRHHLNWVPDAVAFALRPELKGNPPPKPAEEIAPIDPPKKPPTFGEFKTVEEGKEPVAQILRNLSPGLNIERVEVNPKLSIEKFNKYAKEIEKLANDYNLFDQLSPKAKPVLMFNSTGSAYGFIQRSGTYITKINFGHETDGSNNRKYFKDSPHLRGKSRVDDENIDIATVTHEFAHLIAVDHDTKGMAKGVFPKLETFFKELNKLKRQYTKEISLKYEFGDSVEMLTEKKKKINEIYLGSYASKNTNEFMAEAFTEYRLSSNPSKYAKLVGALIDKHFKKSKK